MRKFFFLIIIFMVFVSTQSFATNYGTVMDNNDGTSGQILVNTGINQGSTDIGTWVNPSDIPGLRGPKGDKGDKGDQGIQGVKGNTGASGKDGKDGLNGVNGKDGLNGNDGAKGDKGDQGVAGINGTNGKDYNPEVLNQQNNQLNNMNNRLSKLEQTQAIIGAEVRIYDGKKWVITSFIDYSTNRSTIDRTGIRFTYKFGESYTDKRINELEAKINQLIGFRQGKNEVPNGEFYINDTSIGIKERI